MTTLQLADQGEAADLAAFLARLLRYDRAAAVRLQAAPAPGAPAAAAEPAAAESMAAESTAAEPVGSAEPAAGVLAVFGRLPLGSAGAVVVRTARLAGLGERLDATVSAGQLLEALDEPAAALRVPPTVTGPAWAGLLPPRTGWRRLASPAAAPVAAAVAQAVAEFRARSEALKSGSRTRAALDALADEIWSRPLEAAPAVPLRAAHAAQVLGFIRPGTGLAVFAAGGWLRLSAPHGSVALRSSAAPGSGLGLTPIG
ncbi:hypothetical protein ACIQGZ_18370 [Streptomyces sp. NPDC092296]|uniref:hypothetical protein n=1 Tax=Streptomyces sp. NPDC092296 TaxID=3366012 RepID=UPI00381A8FFF